MRKGFLIYEEMHKYFLIYEEDVSHIWLCNCSILNFHIFEDNFILFLSVYYYKIWGNIAILHIVRHPLGTEIKSNTVVVNSSLYLISKYVPRSHASVNHFVKRLLHETKCEKRSLKWVMRNNIDFSDFLPTCLHMYMLRKKQAPYLHFRRIF